VGLAIQYEWHFLAANVQKIIFHETMYVSGVVLANRHESHLKAAQVQKISSHESR
jgi:hypothetical protein